MKRIGIAIALFLLALPLAAEDAATGVAPPPDFSVGEFTIGAEQRSWTSAASAQATTPAYAVAPEASSSKFLEYRDLPQGAVVPGFRFTGKKGALRWDFAGRDVTQKDQGYFFRVERGSLRLSGDYAGIPHSFGFGGRSILSPTTPNNWQLSDAVQSSFQGALGATLPGRNIDYDCQPRVGYTPRPGCLSLLGLVAPSLNAQPANVDFKLQRGRSTLDLRLSPLRDLDVDLVYFHEKRSGYRAANGTSFGFGDVVETAEPLKYVTQDLGLTAAYRAGWGSLHGAVHLNQFKNRYDFFYFDNPFRSTDATDASAYQAPGSASISGAVVGQMALPPDNQAVTERVGTTLKLGGRTRLTADVTLGQWTQDKDPLGPWTTNTSLVMPDGSNAATAPLFARTLGGRIGTTALSAFFHTTVARTIGLDARYRRYELDNETPRYDLTQGYARFDAVWEEIPRANVPYGYTSDLFDAYASYGRGALGVEAGYRHSGMSRKFRETLDTRENVLRLAVDVRASGWLSFRGMAELGSRDYDDYELARSEDASFLEPGPPANQTVLRRPDQAKRDLVRLGGQLEISPSDRLGLFAAYTHTKLEYGGDPVPCQDVELFPGQSQYCPGGVQDPLGLKDDRYDSFSLEASWKPTGRVGLHAFYTYEDGDVLQNGRQSAATLDFSPADVWTSNITTKGHTFGAGAELTLVPDRWTASLLGRYQKIDGNNAIYLQPGFSSAIYGTNPALIDCTSPGPSACSIPAFDDTRLGTLYGWLRYQLARQWRAALGAGYEDYRIDDAQTDSQRNYLPGGFFLQADNRGYHGWLGYLSLTYSFR